MAGRGGHVGATPSRSGKGTASDLTHGGKGTASRGGKGTTSRGGKGTASRGGKGGASLGGHQMADGVAPRGTVADGDAPRATAADGVAASVVPSTDQEWLASAQSSGDGHVPAHLQFRNVLESQVPTNDDDFHVFDDMSQSDDGYTGLMNDAIGIDDFATPLEEHEEQPEDDIEDDEVVEIQKSGWKRGGNYSMQEDEALVSAWENVTTDPVIGKDQPGASYWQRISDYYDSNVKVPSSRTLGSLSHRKMSPKSCTSKGSQMDEALQCFIVGKCSNTMRSGSIEIKKRGSSDLEFDDYGDDDEESGRSTTPSSDWPANKRPPGRKISKERMKRGGGEGDVFQSAVQDIIVTKKELEASRKEDKHTKIEADNQWREYIKTVEERKMAIEQERLRVQEEEAIARKEEASARKEEAIAKKMKQEMKIMFMDISGLDDQ
ncbi:hypothetical protein EJB05_35090, partial [Eragrostis curvula]